MTDSAQRSRSEKPSRRHRRASLNAHTRRTRFLAYCFAFGIVILVLRLMDLQVLRADFLANAADNFRTRTYVLHAKRGDIKDSKGAVLATSVERYNVGVNQKLIGEFVNYKTNSDGKVERDKDGKPIVLGTGAAEAARLLAPKLDMDRAELGGLLLGGKVKSTFVYIKKDISPEKWREINALRIDGIEPEQIMKREYPNGDVGGNVLGYVGETKKDSRPTGQAGIERTQNTILSGKDGSLKVQTAGGGAVVPNGKIERVEAKNGRDVTLTIDRDLQNSLTQALNESVEKNNAKWGSAVAIEIGTGRVLALADSHSPDPSKLSETSPDAWGSRAVQAPVEPGSTGKILTMSAVLDQGKVSPLTQYTVPDLITMPNGERIRDNEPHGTQGMTVAGIIAMSYNTGLIQIGDTIKDTDRFNYMKKFGIGSLSGIELPAESAGILRDVSKWGPRERYTTMFGQAWALTTLQLGQVIATIGNNGVYIPPRIIDSTVGENGTPVPTVTGESHRVVSEKAAKTMNSIMQGVTQPYGTGYFAKVPGYNVAGKTGTAQVPDENGKLTGRVGTFAGLLPAEKPQVAIAVVVYGGAGYGYGGDTAAPVFAQFGSFCMRYLGVSPSSVPLDTYPWFTYQMRK